MRPPRGHFATTSQREPMSRAGAFQAIERKAIKVILGQSNARVLMSDEIDERKAKAIAEILERRRLRSA